MDTVKAARKALAAGGHLALCGNAARYMHPQRERAGEIALHKAKIIASGLEEFACGANWPFAHWYRLPTAEGRESNVQIMGTQEAVDRRHRATEVR